jgi:PAS domain S-box-containing protein
MLIRLLGDLNGRVPTALVCSDARGFIRSAALPASAPCCNADLEGRSLQEFIPEGEATATFWLAELRRNGNVRVGLDLPFEDATLAVDADVILLEGDGQELTAPTEWKQLEAWINAAPIPLLGIDVTGRVQLVNTTGSRFLGRSRQELLNRPLASLFDDPEQARCFKLKLSDGVCDATRASLRCASGWKQPVDLASHRVFEANGESRGWVVRLRGVDEPTEDTYADRADGVEGGLKETLQSVAHELRSPLSSLRAFAQLLERDFGAHLDEIGRKYIERLRSNADRVQTLLEELIDHTWIRGRELKRCWTSASEIFESLAAQLKPELDERGIHLFLPEDPDPIFADPRRLTQVVLNLLQNAIHHMGDVEAPEICISVQASPAGTTLEVRDNGYGIPAELRIFEFFSCTGRARDWRGKGLGLSIVKRIVQAHGGHVEVDSRPGAGAAFRAFFPSS